MAQNYKETAVTGAAWLRCHTIGIQNPYNAPASFAFLEEKVVSVEGETITKQTGTLSGMFDPAAVIDLIDPNTLQPTGQTVTEAELYVILFSKYMQLAAARDAAQP